MTTATTVTTVSTVTTVTTVTTSIVSYSRILSFVEISQFLGEQKHWTPYLSHPIFYGANYSSHHVLSFFTGVNCLSHPVFSMVRTVQATMFLAFSRVLTVWATLLSIWYATVQATIIVSSFTGVTCLGHPIFYGANCSSYNVISLSRVLIVWATLFRTVLTVQATVLLLVMWASATPFYGANC